MTETRTPLIWAIVPAAGMGRRFRGNSPKQLTRIGGRSMLAVVLDALEASQVQGVVAVVNPNILHAIEAERSESPRLKYAVNNHPEGEMIESVQIGLRKAMEWASAPGLSLPSSPTSPLGLLITPGDHPSVTTEAIDTCIVEFAANPRAIVIATCSTRRGHPLIVPEDLARDVLTWPATEPLNRLRERHLDRVLLVDTGDPGILVDIDTREDLDRAMLEG